MKVMKVAKGQSGFTLIELMIVVGIIGILVAIAAPNFARYQSKAKQSEAKIALGAIYSAEKSFYSEYTSYNNNMAGIGYQPEGTKRFYATGWTSDTTPTITGFTQPPAGTAPSGETWTVASYSIKGVPSTWTQCAQSNLTGSAIDATAGQTFTAAAAGEVRMASGCDIWTMDNNKAMSNTQSRL